MTVVDKGALDCTLKARVECAVYRSNDVTKICPGRCDQMIHPNKKETEKIHDVLKRPEAGPIKDPYIYGADSIMLDLEDAVAENQKDAARYSCTMPSGDRLPRKPSAWSRINGLDTPHWQEDIRVCVAGGADTIRIAKTECART